MTVDEMLHRMSSREFSEWQAYYTIEPFGEERADLRQAMTTTAVINTAIDTRKTKPVKPSDFMPYSETPKPAAGGNLLEKFDKATEQRR